MAGKQGPETKLIARMRKAGYEKYGDRLVIVKHHGGPFAQAGVLDLLVCLDGVYGACEVKAPESYSRSVWKALTKGPTVKQRSFAAAVRQAGGVSWFAATVEQFMEGLEAMALAAEGTHHWLSPLVSGNLIGLDNLPICTCTLAGGCEHRTKDGCLYCREAPTSDPCPNLDVADDLALQAGDPDDLDDLDEFDETPEPDDPEQLDDL